MAKVRALVMIISVSCSLAMCPAFARGDPEGVEDTDEPENEPEPAEEPASAGERPEQQNAPSEAVPPPAEATPPPQPTTERPRADTDLQPTGEDRASQERVIGARNGLLTPFNTKLPLIEKELRRVSAFQFHGYLRAGAGQSSEGGNQVCFQDPGAPVKYRLGNECEDYTELIFAMDVYRPEPEGRYFRVNTRLAFDGGWLVRFQDVQLFAPELYVEAANLFRSGALRKAKFWAGKRFYRQDQVHINDFYFWDLSGPGGGVENIDVGIGALAIAYFRTANVQSDQFTVDAIGDEGMPMPVVVPGMTPVPGNQIVSKVFAHWSEVPINVGGTFDLAFEFRKLSGDRLGAVGTYGLAAYAMHTQKIGDGFNQAIFEYGQGIAADIGLASDLAAENDARTYRFIDWLVLQPSSHWTAAIVGIYQRSTGMQSQPKHWVSFGTRPILNVMQYFRVALEAGMDLVDPDQGGWRNLGKVTLAPELATGGKFFDRPVLRVFATYARWNTEAAVNGVVLSDEPTPVSDDRDMFTFGVQAEAWW